MTDPPDRSEIGRLLRSFPRRLQAHVCAECGRAFETVTKRAEYCSSSCRQRAHYRRSKSPPRE